MTLPKLDLKVGVSELFAALNFLALCFTAGMVWQTYTGKGEQSGRDIEDLKSEVAQLRQQHTAIAVLQTDVNYIKDSSARVEAMVLSILREKRASN